MRVVISGEIDLPAERREAALTGAQDLIRMAREEPGCVHYAWTADLNHPGRVCVFEEWDSQANLAAHLAGPAYQGMLAHLGAFGLTGAVTRKYAVTHVEPVYDEARRPRADFFTRPDLS